MLKRVMSFLLLVSLISVVGLLGVSQQKVTVAVVWSGAELEAFEKALVLFEQDTGINVVVESVGRDLPAVLVARLAAGNPPDMAGMPNPGQMKEFADQGALVALNGIVDLSESPQAFVDLGSVGGKNLRSIHIRRLEELSLVQPESLRGKGL